MKQSKRIISVLMALVMLLTAIPMSAYAAHSDYTVAGGYDILDDPYVTPQQAASMLLDMVDAMLKESNQTIEVNIYVGKKTIDLRSIDQATTSITDFWNWWAISIAFGVLDFADIEAMNMTWIENCPKRTDAGKTDLDVVLALCNFLRDNYDRVGKIVDDTFNYGFVTTVTTLPDVVHHIPETLKAAITKPLNGNVAPDPSVTVDELVQKMIDGLIIGVQDPETGLYSGLLPSMLGKTNIMTTSVYTLLTDAINAGMNDILVPMLANLLVGAGDMVLNVVYGLAPGMVYTPEDLATPLTKLTATLSYLFTGGGLDTYFVLDNTGLHISDNLITMVDSLLRVGLTIIPTLGLLKNTTTFKTEDEIKDMTTPECYAYLGKLLINEYVEYADIPDTATSFRSVITYFLIGLAKDVLPEMDFESMITAGTLNPFTDGVFIVGAALGRYYLNGILPVDIQEGLTFEQTISAVFDWFMSKYGGLFDTADYLPTDTVWNKIDKIIFDIIPLNWLPAQFTGSKYMVMDWLIGNILDFNYVGLASIVQRNPNSELNNSVVKVLLNTLSRVLKSAIGNHLILPMNLTTFESVFSKINCRALIQNLCQNLADHGSVLLNSLFPLATSLLGLWTPATYIRKAPVGAPLVGIEALQALLDSYTPRNLNANIQYYEDGYNYFGEEDFTELRTYFNYTQAKTEAQGLLDAYARDPESLDLQMNTDVAFRVKYYFDKMTVKTELCATQLTKEVSKSYYADYENAPANTYEASSYATWLQAYNFAKEVRVKAISNTTGIRQSMVSEARHRLFKAVKGLKDFVPYADYTQLDWYISQAQTRYNTLPVGIYTDESIQNLATVLEAAKSIDRTISFENQAIVDTAASDLYTAMYGLLYILAPAINPTPDSTLDFWGNPITPVVNTVRKYIYGLSQGGFTISDITTVGGAATIIIKTAQGYGTGTKIRLMFNGLAIATFTVIVFGDVNGDGNIDDGDSGILVDSENKLYTLSADKKYAGDLNGDGNVDAMDAGIATDVLNCLYTIDQTTGMYAPT